MLTVLFSLAQIWTDFNIVLKIFVIMTIYSWTRNHFGNSALGWVIFGAVTFFVVFELWSVFGSIYIFYMLLLFGFSQIMIDFFFITAGMPRPGMMGKPHGKMESPVSSGKELAQRQAHMAAQQQQFAQSFMRR